MLIFSLWLLLSFCHTNSGKFLKRCSLQDWKETGSNRITDEWFLWARLYSYCMQADGDTIKPLKDFDKDCSTSNCQQCMTVCEKSLPFNKSSCDTDCKDSVACKNGCAFYDTIKSGNKAAVEDPSNLPSSSTSALKSPVNTQYNSTFDWPVVTSSNNEVASVYLVRLRVKRENFDSTSVIGLTSSTDYVLTEPIMCANKGFISAYDPGIQFQLQVTAINMNGNSSNMLFKFTDFEKIAAAENLQAKEIDFSITSGPKIHVNINWQNLKNNVYKEYEIKRNLPSCTKREHFQILVTSMVPWRRTLDKSRESVNDTGLLNTNNDVLETCSFTYELYARYGQCSIGPVLKYKYNYPGCDNIPFYGNNSCHPATTPKPTDGPIPTKGFNLSEPFVVSRVNQTCIQANNSSGNSTSNSSDNSTFVEECTNYTTYYNVTLFWEHPVTSTPIKSYQLIYGENTGIFNFIPGKPFDLPANTTSYLVPMMEAGHLFYYAVHAETDSSGPFQYIDTSKYVKVQVPKVQRATTRAATTTVPVTPTARTTSDPKSDAYVIPIIIVALVLVFIVIIFLYRRNRNNRNKNRFGKDGAHDLYVIESYLDHDSVADEWELSSKLFKLDKKIGEGAFGTVYVAVVKSSIISRSRFAKQQGGTALLEGKDETDAKVAVKLLKEGASESEFGDFREEISLMKGIGYHKNIVNMIGCSTVSKPLCLLVEFMENGDLLHFLRKRRTKLCTSTMLGGESTLSSFMYTTDYQNTLQQPTINSDNSAVNLVPSSPNPSTTNDDEEFETITPDDLLSFAWQIASGMEYLSATKLVHRDLAARNVLVGSEKNVKISDFGLTRKVSDELIYMSNKNRRLPVKWMSVEAIFDQMFTTYSDVWAYGVVLFEIVTLGGTPYPTINNKELLSLLKSGYRMEKPENCAEPMYDIMLHCWNEDPAQRPTFPELREHLEDIISQGDRYFSFDIDEENTYYNVASFKSVTDDEDDQLAQLKDKPMQVKPMEEFKKLAEGPIAPQMERYTFDTPRYTSPQGGLKQDPTKRNQVNHAYDGERRMSNNNSLPTM